MFIQIFDFDVYLICIGENKYCTWTKHRSSSTGFSLLISIGLKTSQLAQLKLCYYIYKFGGPNRFRPGVLAVVNHCLLSFLKQVWHHQEVNKFGSIKSTRQSWSQQVNSFFLGVLFQGNRLIALFSVPDSIVLFILLSSCYDRLGQWSA